MRATTLVLLLVSAASALLMNAPLASRAAVAPARTTELTMKKSHSGASASHNPQKDQQRRGKIAKLVWACDTAEKARPAIFRHSWPRSPTLHSAPSPPPPTVTTAAIATAIAAIAAAIAAVIAAAVAAPACCPSTSTLGRGRRPRLADPAPPCAPPPQVQSELLSASTESMLLKMNWKIRHSMGHKIKARAAQFGVAIPAGFAAWDHSPKSAPKHLLKPAMS